MKRYGGWGKRYRVTEEADSVGMLWHPRANPRRALGAAPAAAPKGRATTARTGVGNFLLLAFPGLIVKDSYWRWPARDRAGNTIDFFVQVLGLSFQQSMLQILGGGS